MSIESTVEILLVEDDDVDVEGIMRAFEKHKIANPVITVTNGVDALAKLRGEGVEPIRRPYLILLDLNLPRMSGIEFLQAIRDDDNLKDSIVFVLTTSDDDKDKVAAYDQHVAGYMVKANAGEDFLNVVSMLDHYWRVIEFPPLKK